MRDLSEIIEKCTKLANLHSTIHGFICGGLFEIDDALNLRRHEDPCS